jgi:rhamnulose-1-phosphate aldolase
MQLNKINLGAQGIAAEITEVATLLWKKGWAEGSAGNISVNVTEFFPAIRMDFRSYTMVPLQVSYPALAHNHIFITTKGSRLRNIVKNPGNSICLVKISKKGDAYQVLYVDEEFPAEPSSELPSHLAIHNLMAKRGGEDKAIIHAHVDEIVVMTHDKDLKNEAKLNEALMQMHTETAYFIPEGVGYVPLLTPGSEELAKATLKSLKNHKVVVWERHGCLAIGKDADEAFDRLDLIAKAAKIYKMLNVKF